MAEYEERNQLDYRLGGDTIDEFGQKYKAEMTRVFRFLNDLKQNKINSIEYTEPSSGQLKAEDGKLYIRNESNDAWVLLGEIAANFGFKPADADFISSDELSHGKIAEVNALDVPKTVTTDALPSNKIDDVNALDFSKVVTTDNLPQDKIDDVNGIEFDKIVTTDNLTQSKIDDVKAADLPNMVVKQDISIPNEGLVTTEPQKLVQTNNDGVLPVNILGNAAKLAGYRVETDIIQDGQVMTFRAATKTWHNENKGVIGSGKALNLYDGDNLLCSYVGDEVRDFDLGITANKKYVEDTVGSKADKTELSDLEQLIKQYVADELSKYLPLDGGALTGSTIKRAVDNGFLDLYGGTGWTSGGAAISLNGKDRAGATAGAFGVRVNNGTASKEMWLKPDGSFTVGDKEIKAMAFPSKTIISVPLTFSAGSATYTAPANGYFMALAKSTAATYAVLETNTTSGVRHRQNVTAAGEYMSNTIPVKKGDSITVIIAGSTAFQYASFIYADGEV